MNPTNYTTSIEKLYPQSDLIALDVHLCECKAGVVDYVAKPFRIAYTVMASVNPGRTGMYEPRDYPECQWVHPGWGPLLYLWSACHIKWQRGERGNCSIASGAHHQILSRGL